MNHLIKKDSKAAIYFQMFGTPRMIRVMAAIWIHHGDVGCGGAVGHYHVIAADCRLVVAQDYWPPAH